MAPPAAAAAGEAAPAAAGAASTARRDLLLSIQEQSQARWEAEKVFESDAPGEGEPKPRKFFGTFPYPYMNGLLHLGHAFSLSKLEFAAAHRRLCGDKVLFPQAFHCTGMPIKACADRLAQEMEDFGCPPVFPGEEEETEQESAAAAAAADAAAASAAAEKDPSKFSGKKSKAAAKKGTGATQWEIMRLSGIPEDEIPAFKDPAHWLEFFPPLAKRDIAAMGCGVDWRRSFITTDANPFYDSFVRWQFNSLRKAGKVVKDKRAAVFSPKDGQPCADHDRASGEGVGPQEYCLVKMRVQTDKLLSEGESGNGESSTCCGFAAVAAQLAESHPGSPVFLLAATLRPETMFGQTNCWALPTGEYGVYEGAPASPSSSSASGGGDGAAGDGGNGGDGNSSPPPPLYVVGRHAARNMAYQDLLASGPDPNPAPVRTVTGQELLGVPLSAPRAPHDTVFVLPLLTISMTKGTGIVTSVPSDSPDDFAALRDLKQKPALRAKYGVKDEWCLPFDPVPIIDIPGYGSLAAEKACEEFGVASQNDAKKLADAKAAVYLKGFTEGVMLVGDHAGEKVSDAKPKLKATLVAAGDGIIYSEPERAVVSRSGDACVVALTDQWYLTYGEDEWAASARECLSALNTYGDECRHAFEHTLGWLRQWACSRSFGLGTRLPWDPSYLVESLSDSTIYMAYYCVAHLFQGGDMYGKADSSSQPLRAEELTDEVWDFIFRGAPFPASAGFAEDSEAGEAIRKAKREFEFWYPMDLRVSGKDLINNHLSFCIYTHTAIWPPSKPGEENGGEQSSNQSRFWPRGVRCNGHLLLNAEKMSKSTGNFKTLRQAIGEYGADAMRIALADAGDALDDANFEHGTANSAILRLTRELEWISAVLGLDGEAGSASSNAAAATRTGEFTFADRVFDNEINAAVASAGASYEKLLFREALKAAVYDLHAARDAWRVACGSAGAGDSTANNNGPASSSSSGGGLHAGLARRYVEISTLLLAPLAPHTCEHVWRDLLKKAGTVLTAGWPSDAPAPDAVLRAAAAALEGTINSARRGIAKLETPPKKAKKDDPKPRKVARVTLYVAEAFGGWHAPVLESLSSAYDEAKNAFTPDNAGALAAAVAAAAEPFVAGGGQPGDKALKQTVIPFAKKRMDDALCAGASGGGGGKGLLQARLPFDEAELLESNAGYFARCLGLSSASAAAVRVVRGPPPPLGEEGAGESANAVAGGKGAAEVALPGEPVLRFERVSE